MSSNKSQTSFFDIPEEIFTMITAYIDDPADYFHLAVTCKAMMDKMEPTRNVLRLEHAGIVRYLAETPQQVRSVVFDMYPYKSVMNWVIVTWQPEPILMKVIQDYLAYFPEMIYGDMKVGIPPAWHRALHVRNLDALEVLENVAKAGETDKST